MQFFMSQVRLNTVRVSLLLSDLILRTFLYTITVVDRQTQVCMVMIKDIKVVVLFGRKSQLNASNPVESSQIRFSLRWNCFGFPLAFLDQLADCSVHLVSSLLDPLGGNNTTSDHLDFGFISKNNIKQIKYGGSR